MDYPDSDIVFTCVSAQAGLLSGAVITLDTFLALEGLLLFSMDLNHFADSLCSVLLLYRAKLEWQVKHKLQDWCGLSLNNSNLDVIDVMPKDGNHMYLHSIWNEVENKAMSQNEENSQQKQVK